MARQQAPHPLFWLWFQIFCFFWALFPLPPPKKRTPFLTDAEPHFVSMEGGVAFEVRIDISMQWPCISVVSYFSNVGSILQTIHKPHAHPFIYRAIIISPTCTQSPPPSTRSSRGIFDRSWLRMRTFSRRFSLLAGLAPLGVQHLFGPRGLCQRKSLLAGFRSVAWPKFPLR